MIAANVVVYAALRHYEFVDFGDQDYVTGNPAVAAGLTWRGVAWAFTTAHASSWHPLTWLSHMLDVQVYGMDAGGHHLTNLLLHIANTLLLFGVLHRMTGALGRSSFVAALFAVHPLHVESVAWVAERKDVLSTLFCMLTLWSYVSYVRHPRATRYMLVLVWFALGLLAKPMLVTLPFVLVLLDVWPLERVTMSNVVGALTPAGRAGSEDPRHDRVVVARLIREKVPLLGLACAAIIVTLLIQRGGIVAIPLRFRLANATVSYVAYIGKMLWPTRLAVLYPYRRLLPAWWVLASVVLLAGLTVLLIRAGRRYPYLAVGWLWYLGTLIPVIGFVQVGNQSMADRYTYVPLIGLFLIVAWGTRDLLATWRDSRFVLAAAAGLALLGCATAARAQVHVWENSVALWQRAIDVNSDNFFAHSTLADVLERQGKFDEAIAHRLEVARLRPRYAEAHVSAGKALFRAGRTGEAIISFAEAVRLSPDSPETHYSLATALARQGQLFKADREFSEALRLRADYPEAHHSLGLNLARRGKLTEAIAQYTEALRLRPDYADAHNNLGIALMQQQKAAEATSHFSEAARLQPGLAGAHYNLATALAEQGQVDEGLMEMLEAVRLNPNDATWHYKLAVLYQKNGNTAEGVRHLARASELDPKDPAVRRALDSFAVQGRR